MKAHKNPGAWKMSMQFVRDIYMITTHFPPEENFGLVSQIRRAAVSVPVNMAESAARRSKKNLLISCT